MKAAIFIFALVAVLGRGLVRIVAYFLKKPWTDSQIEAVGTAIKWVAFGALVMLTIDVIVRL